MERQGVFIPRVIRLFRHMSYRAKLMAALTAIALGIALYIGGALYKVASANLYEMSSLLSQNNINIVHSQLIGYFESIQDSLTQILRLPELREAAEARRMGDEQAAQSAARLEMAIQEELYLGAAKGGAKIRMINVYCKNGFTFSSAPENRMPYTDYESARAYFTERGHIGDSNYIFPQWCEHGMIYDRLGHRRHSIIGIRMIYANGTMEELGMVVAAIDEEEVYKLYSGFSPKALIINHRGELLSGGDKTQLGRELSDPRLLDAVLGSEKSTDSVSYTVDGQVRLFTFKRLGNRNTTFIIPFEYYSDLQKREYERFVMPVILVAVGGVLISILFALLLSRTLSSSLLALKDVVQQVYDGDLSARYHSENADEIAYLGEKINDMLVHINGLFEIQAQDARTRRELELRLMQSQINPHLLYNTLDSVLWAVKSRDTARAERLIVSLSEFFKLTLSRGSPLIPLESELSMIRHYIEIQRLARGQEIRLKTRIPEALLSHPIIKLTLQPLVENAILHGFSGYRDDGEITISAEVQDEDLVLAVEDNGIGILPEELSALNEALNTYPPPANQQHFGLYNVNRRLKNSFGHRYGITIESSISEYTRVIVRLPARKAAKARSVNSS